MTVKVLTVIEVQVCLGECMFARRLQWFFVRAPIPELKLNLNYP